MGRSNPQSFVKLFPNNVFSAKKIVGRRSASQSNPTAIATQAIRCEGREAATETQIERKSTKVRCGQAGPS